MMNILQRRAFRVRAINALVANGWSRSQARDAVHELGDDEVIECCAQVAATKGITVPLGAFGDGSFLQWFLDFWSQYGDEIIAFIMMLFKI
jgi:hypothetical protein